MDKYKIFAVLFFGIGALTSLVLATYQYVRIILNKDKVKNVYATVIETSTAVAETMKVTNSRWASVEFWVNGKQYISAKRISVPMNTSIGDKVKVAYLKDNPNKIFTPNKKKANIFLVIGIMCLAVVIYFIS